MSYQVLARKWRPKSFAEMVGQQHVLKALINALENDRLHHAYLFTGTRGVGKTTVARILAKCLNCEAGVSSEPCGTCASCREIAEGRSVDLIEVDAASRTKVEDTRELLDNVQYAPSHSRYKLYLIDEVHMLSNHSFNALLKTLEEPPEHAKFLLATTDPHKLPATVLSRCLQFNLKNMVPEQIVAHLQSVLTEEHIAFEDDALVLLARAANGSMRDALSLTDQAIAFGSGELRQADVRDMLGTVDRTQVFQLIEAVIQGDGGRVLGVIQSIAEHAPDFLATLDELIAILHQLTVGFVVPDGLGGHLDESRFLALLAQTTLDDVQLYYQLAAMSRKELQGGVDPRTVLEMLCLRMIAFTPSALFVLPTDAAEQGNAPNPEADPAKKPEPPVAPVVPEAPNTAQQANVRQTALSSSRDAEGRTQTTSNPAEHALRPSATSSAPAISAPSRADEIPVEGGSIDRSSADVPPTMGTSGYGPFVKPTAAEEAFVKESSVKGASVEAVPVKKASTEVAPVGGGAAESPASGAAPHAPVEDSLVEDAPRESAPEHRESAQRGAEGLGRDAVPKDAPQEGLPTLASWPEFCSQLALGGILGSIALHCSLESVAGDRLFFCLDQRHATLFNDRHRDQLTKVLAEAVGYPVTVDIEVGEPSALTPYAHQERQKAERLRRAQEAVAKDETLQLLIDAFDASIIEGSIAPPS
jgi:DNA polymerase-3 subunit gamma/tau